MPANFDISGLLNRQIPIFHSRIFDSLSKKDFKSILKSKNPYLFISQNISTAEQFIKLILSAWLSSSEETIFGDCVLQPLAIEACKHYKNGRPISAAGLDLEFDEGTTRYIIEIKSGPKWANKNSFAQMLNSFRQVRATIRTTDRTINVVAINGCCYGKDSKPYKPTHDYYKYCGQEFWSFITGVDQFYTDIIQPLIEVSRSRTGEFQDLHDSKLIEFTDTFKSEFCVNEEIIWDKVVHFNSSK